MNVFHKCFLAISYVPDTVPDARDIKTNKRKSSTFQKCPL